MCLPVKPYKVEREWKHLGLSCAVVQNREASNRCGYVRVPPGHPLFGKSYDDVDINVHGGLTFAEEEPCTEHEDGQGWWFGFDCAHAGDITLDPSLSRDELPETMRFVYDIQHKFPIFAEHYWTQSEVEAETESLAAQLASDCISYDQ